MEINKIELASNLAHNSTVNELIVNGSDYSYEDDLYKVQNDSLNYKEEVQDKFNDWYNYYLTEIEKTNING